jgi:hypothetical protein
MYQVKSSFTNALAKKNTVIYALDMLGTLNPSVWLLGFGAFAAVLLLARSQFTVIQQHLSFVV